MSNLNDAKQLILETEIDNVIEESFLGSLNKVKFEVAGVLAGAAAILLKLPEKIATYMTSDLTKYSDHISSKINSLDISKIPEITQTYHDHTVAFAKKFGEMAMREKIDLVRSGVSDSLDKSTGEDSFTAMLNEMSKGMKSDIGKINNYVDDIKQQTYLKHGDLEISTTIKNRLDNMVSNFQDRLEEARSTSNELINLNSAKEIKPVATHIEELLKQHSEQIQNIATSIVAFGIFVFVVSAIYKVYTYIKSNRGRDAKKVVKQSALLISKKILSWKRKRIFAKIK